MRRRGQVLGLALVGGIGCAGGPGGGTTSATAASTTTGASTSTEGASSTSGVATTAAESESVGTSGSGSTTECKRDLGEALFGCDAWLQDCCEGDKCTPASNGSSPTTWKCVPVDPEPDAVGEPCTIVDNQGSGLDSCEKGAMCWNVDPETNIGECVALCEGNLAQCQEDPASCCDDHFYCRIYSGSILILCLEMCHPLTLSCLDPAEACYFFSGTFGCASDASGEMGAPGDPCEFINTCDPGTFCGDPATFPGCDPLVGGCCIPFCLLDSPECLDKTECVAWYEPPYVPPGYEDLGACVIPP